MAYSNDNREIVVGSIYRHYKGNEYKVLNIARHSENLELMVVYKALKDDGDIWVRPLEMFQEQVEIDGEVIYRFEELANNPQS